MGLLCKLQNIRLFNLGRKNRIKNASLFFGLFISIDEISGMPTNCPMWSSWLLLSLFSFTVFMYKKNFLYKVELCQCIVRMGLVHFTFYRLPKVNGWTCFLLCVLKINFHWTGSLWINFGGHIQDFEAWHMWPWSHMLCTTEIMVCQKGCTLHVLLW